MGYVRIIRPAGCPEAAGQLMRAAKGIAEQAHEGAALILTGPCPETSLPHVGWYVSDPAHRWKLLGWTMAATVAYLDDLLDKVPMTSEERARLQEFRREYQSFKERFFGAKQDAGRDP